VLNPAGALLFVVYVEHPDTYPMAMNRAQVLTEFPFFAVFGCHTIHYQCAVRVSLEYQLDCIASTGVFQWCIGLGGFGLPDLFFHSPSIFPFSIICIA
jgi:hypothetical protein